MKAPVWGMCCAVVCSAIFGIGVALHVAGQLRAADSPSVPAIGPDAPPLARPIDGTGNRLDYPNPAALPTASNMRPAENPVVGVNNFTPTTVSPAPPMSYPLPPQSATAPSSYASAPASPGGMTAALNPAPTNGLRQPVASQPLSPSARRNCRLQHLPAHRVRLKWQRTRRNSIRNNRRRLMAFTRTPNPMRWHPVATRGPIFKPPSGNRPIRIRPRAIPARRPIPRRPEVAVNQRRPMPRLFLATDR